MKINVVAFSIPDPANYGGIIDVYRKIVALQHHGCEIYLHCFQYGREISTHLEKICKQVFYYRRNRSLIHQCHFNPFIMQSRINKNLNLNLIKFEFPILYEGLHTIGSAFIPSLKNRTKLLRMHNVESQYYKNLSIISDNIFDQIYFRLEAAKLSKLEKKLDVFDRILAISPKDTKYLSQMYDGKITLIPPFHHFELNKPESQYGSHILYHGDLSIIDNQKSVHLLVKAYLKSGVNLPLLIIGNNPTKEIIELGNKNDSIKVIGNQSDAELEKLIKNAHINLIWSYNSSGLKLKLIHTLLLGRHCIANKISIADHNLFGFVHQANDFDQILIKLRLLSQEPYVIQDFEKRKAILENHYSNIKNARKIIDIVNNLKKEQTK